ncbi:MAG: hypothetical protein FJ284_06365 [Planctomycetes bacterium]|nr:hypothetical protein [Planctomycetota bacterium]
MPNRLPPLDQRPSSTARGVALIDCLLMTGCSSERSLSDIERESRSLDVLYLTADTGKQVRAPASAGVFVDRGTGELCFPAYECRNPACPGRQGGDRPFLFMHRDVMLKAGPDGEVVRDDMPAGRDPAEVIRSRGGFPDPTCPACWAARRGGGEATAEAKQFLECSQPHVLPESARRRTQLEEEYRQKAGTSAARRRSRLAQEDETPRPSHGTTLPSPPVASRCLVCRPGQRASPR